jgi:hypothetical protein
MKDHKEVEGNVRVLLGKAMVSEIKGKNIEHFCAVTRLENWFLETKKEDAKGRRTREKRELRALGPKKWGKLWLIKATYYIIESKISISQFAYSIRVNLYT